MHLHWAFPEAATRFALCLSIASAGSFSHSSMHGIPLLCIQNRFLLVTLPRRVLLLHCKR
eukprot:2059627-Amphidinium_carterae.1